LLALVSAALCVLGCAPSAAAAEDDAGATGLLRMMHLSPDTPAVDAAIDSVSDPGVGIVLSAVSYGDVSPYQMLPPGTYTVSVRAPGADPSTPPALATTVTVEAGAATTIAGVGAFAELRFEVLPDDLTLPPAGQARARVANATAAGSLMDLALDGGPALATDLAPAAHTEYVDVPGGPGTLTVTPGSGTPTGLPVDLAAGSVYTVLVLDREGGGLEVTTTLDAASPGMVPVGGVEAGAGGAAGSGPPTGGLALVAVALAALALPLRARFGRRAGTRYAAR
jgi:Domain of unknown function (DUF4397)